MAVINHYILNQDGVPVICEDLETWSKWMFENPEHRRVKLDKIGDAEVSTVFLGLDHGFGNGAPVLWETMVFGGPMSNHQVRCRGSMEQAEAMHEDVVRKVKEQQQQRNK